MQEAGIFLGHESLLQERSSGCVRFSAGIFRNGGCHDEGGLAREHPAVVGLDRWQVKGCDYGSLIEQP